MRELTIAGRRIADDEPCYVIAEIGNNHQGDMATALRLIDAAADAGCHAVKFQKRSIDTLYTRALLDKPYDNPASFGATYGAHRHALELPIDQYPLLIAAAHDRGIACIATAFDEQSADELAAVGVDAIKLASGALTDVALHDRVGKLGLPVIQSTGGSMRLADAMNSRMALYPAPVALLHCTASYPCAFHELNLMVIYEMRETMPDHVIGWSGHDNGIAMALVAYTLGARIIEKHFTLNRAMKGTDHAFSLEPSGMTKLCRDLQRAYVAMGDGVKRWYASERAPIAKMRRTLTADGWRITGEVPVAREG